jgi:putative spermidine/putrescine transport system ATP-binding protein
VSAIGSARGRGAIELRQVSKRYGKETVVDRVSATIAPGEFFSLLGPSGSGKTTTLMMVAGFAEVDGGQILVDGADIADMPPQRRGFGMVFQNYAIFPHMNVFDNVAYGLQNRGFSKEQVRSRVGEALSLVELTGYEQRFRHQLSGGQQQRVALARSVAYEPDVLLLDEPFSNLDAKLRKTMRMEVRKLQQRLRLTTVFVTHDQQEALSLSDVVAVMNRGRVEQVGSPAEVYERPRSEFVADFIGSTNLLPGVVRSCSAGQAAIDLAGGATLLVPHDEPLVEGAAVKVLAKPEKLQLTAPDSGAVQGTVSSVAYLGAVTQYEVELAACSIEVLLPADAQPALRVGSFVGVDLPVEALRLIVSEGG